MQVFEDHAFCHGCKKVADIFSFVMKRERVRFEQAVEWILKWKSILPKTVELDRPKDREYKGPVPANWVHSWHLLLDDEKRQYLRDRLLTDETLDNNLIGYRADNNAFVIPFWRGVPGQSEIDIVQYRQDPRVERTARKYWGEKGYNKPSIINFHLINPLLVVIVFGTLDALLGAQDGLPMVSTNGATTFANPKRAECVWLRRELAKTERVLIVPDNTPVEFESAHKLALQLPQAEIRYFEHGSGWKDYNDYRLAGKTADDFWQEILQVVKISLVKGPGGTMWLIHEHHIPKVGQVLAKVSEGDWYGAAEIIDEMRHDDPASYERPHIIRWSLQRMCELRLEPVQPVFSPDDWRTMAADFDQCHTYHDIGHVLVEWANKANERLGGF